LSPSDGGGFLVHLQAGDQGTAHGPFELELGEGRQINNKLANIQSGVCSLDDLRYVGSQLFDCLIAGKDVRALFDQARTSPQRPLVLPIHLVLPDDLLDLPWEALYDDRRDKYIVSNTSYGLIRDPQIDIGPIRSTPVDHLPLKILVVVPEGAGLLIDHELANLRSLVEALGHDKVVLVSLVGHVTIDDLRAKLAAEQWHVVHFIGHGTVDEAGEFSVRMNLEGASSEHWVDGEAFADAFRRLPPRLVVLNCCLGAAVSASRYTMSNLGPSLLLCGVPNIIAMRYEIPDHVAVRFAGVFYQTLLTEKASASIGQAMLEARCALYSNKSKDSYRCFITPVFFQNPGNDQLAAADLFAQPRGPAPAVVAKVAEAVAIPDDLVESLRDGRCLLFTGPGLLRLGAMRGGKPKEIGQLVDEIINDCEYPARRLQCDDFGLTLTYYLPSVFQFFSAAGGSQRRSLIQKLRVAYQGLTPSQAVRDLALWSTPAIIHSFFDSLLEDAASATRFEILQTLDASAADKQSTALIYLRGSLQKDSSLVLTEEDHEEQIEKIGHLPNRIADLMTREVGRSMLFLGVSPQDPLVRRMTSQLLAPVARKNRGAVYFVCSPAEAKLDAYWPRWDVQWIQHGLRDVLGAIQARLDEDRAQGQGAL
jgi:hypothetical protein